MSIHVRMYVCMYVYTSHTHTHLHNFESEWGSGKEVEELAGRRRARGIATVGGSVISRVVVPFSKKAVVSDASDIPQYEIGS